ncbi:interactor protein for cytohesin exchange factors 1-like [Anableps anableps]
MNLQSAPRPGAMSRRRVSVKDLGEADCQGWLQRRKDGRSFLGGKWKRFWFVLKKSSLYWYCNKTGEKAEGFINLSGFSIEPARACRKKHVITASHPHVVTIFIAADSFADMNKWISRLRAAAEPNELVSAAECYSEDSDQDTDESGSASHSLDSELDQAEPEPVSKPSFSETCPALSSQAEDVPPPGCSSDPAAATRTRTSSASCSDLPASGDSSEAAGIPQLHVTEEREGTPLHPHLVTMTTASASSHRASPRFRFQRSRQTRWRPSTSS